MLDQNSTYANRDDYRVLFQALIEPDELKWTTVLKSIIEASGMTVNTASLTAAQAHSNYYAHFSVPNLTESETNNYVFYAQKLLGSGASLRLF